MIIWEYFFRQNGKKMDWKRCPTHDGSVMLYTITNPTQHNMEELKWDNKAKSHSQVFQKIHRPLQKNIGKLFRPLHHLPLAEPDWFQMLINMKVLLHVQCMNCEVNTPHWIDQPLFITVIVSIWRDKAPKNFNPPPPQPCSRSHWYRKSVPVAAWKRVKSQQLLADLVSQLFSLHLGPQYAKQSILTCYSTTYIRLGMPGIVTLSHVTQVIRHTSAQGFSAHLCFQKHKSHMNNIWIRSGS